MTPERIDEKVRQSRDKNEYRRWLAVRLSLKRRLPHHEIADILAVSLTAVDQWLGAYNREGEAALRPKTENCGRKPFLKAEEEREILEEFTTKAENGELVTAGQIRAELARRLGRPVSAAYPYRVLERGGWRKIKPRPVHPKANKEAQQELKKTSKPTYWKPPEPSTKIIKGQSE